MRHDRAFPGSKKLGVSKKSGCNPYPENADTTGTFCLTPRAKSSLRAAAALSGSTCRWPIAL